ncbi:TetR/AcrR family transcriptional regulator [Paraburkholderia youngii]|uniref:TetR/AcrR family transcriptional regulator n=1 Tax=Paraburkholderia youngii TaxID=2782701 RepID=UPI003D1B85F1
MRKQPRQARSRATVETILQSGARILSDEGWAGFTTNKVADLAGISIGSLYQYFPDKLSLVDAIRQRHLDDCLAVIRKSNINQQSSAKFVAHLVHAMVAAHSAYPGLHRVLLDEAPSSDEYRNPNSQFEIGIRQRNPSVEEGSVIGMDGVKGRRYAAAGGRKRASVLRSRSPRSRPFSSSA